MALSRGMRVQTSRSHSVCVVLNEQSERLFVYLSQCNDLGILRKPSSALPIPCGFPINWLRSHTWFFIKQMMRSEKHPNFPSKYSQLMLGTPWKRHPISPFSTKNMSCLWFTHQRNKRFFVSLEAETETYLVLCSNIFL